MICIHIRTAQTTWQSNIWGSQTKCRKRC